MPPRVLGVALTSFLLAGALLRDPQPGAASLAAAWANQFPVAVSSDPQRLNEAVSIAAEFLVIFDLALRRLHAPARPAEWASAPAMLSEALC